MSYPAAFSQSLFFTSPSVTAQGMFPLSKTISPTIGLANRDYLLYQSALEKLSHNDDETGGAVYFLLWRCGFRGLRTIVDQVSFTTKNVIGFNFAWRACRQFLRLFLAAEVEDFILTELSPLHLPEAETKIANLLWLASEFCATEHKLELLEKQRQLFRMQLDLQKYFFEALKITTEEQLAVIIRLSHQEKFPDLFKKLCLKIGQFQSETAQKGLLALYRSKAIPLSPAEKKTFFLMTLNEQKRIIPEWQSLLWPELLRPQATQKVNLLMDTPFTPFLQLFLQNETTPLTQKEEVLQTILAKFQDYHDVYLIEAVMDESFLEVVAKIDSPLATRYLWQALQGHSRWDSGNGERNLKVERIAELLLQRNDLNFTPAEIRNWQHDPQIPAGRKGVHYFPPLMKIYGSLLLLKQAKINQQPQDQALIKILLTNYLTLKYRSRPKIELMVQILEPTVLEKLLPDWVETFLKPVRGIYNPALENTRRFRLREILLLWGKPTVWQKIPTNCFQTVTEEIDFCLDRIKSLPSQVAPEQALAFLTRSSGISKQNVAEHYFYLTSVAALLPEATVLDSLKQGQLHDWLREQPKAYYYILALLSSAAATKEYCHSINEIFGTYQSFPPKDALNYVISQFIWQLNKREGKLI